MFPEKISYREELRQLLRRDAILWSTPQETLRTREGKEVPWGLNTWGVTLTPHGLRLAAQCLLDTLPKFESTQLVCYGYSALPLLTTCILLGEGRYTGIVIRDQKKQYGACRRIEGNGDKNRPVVILDDALSAGTSLRKTLTALEEEGFRAEGSVALVYFPWRGGKEWAQALGFKMETVFDVWKDLEIAITPYTPSHLRVNVDWDPVVQVSDGLHPAQAARFISEHYLKFGTVPHPPNTFDREYQALGGVFVSFRDRSTEQRLARNGYWHFDTSDINLPRDVTLATIQTLRSAQPAIERHGLDRLKIGISFLGQLEPITPRHLDFSKYGIVVQSQIQPMKRGGALPNTQVYTSEIEQYRHARVNNAKIPMYEPYTLYRHEVTKCIEPGEDWMVYGAQDTKNLWKDDLSIGEILTQRAQDILEAKLFGTEPTTQPVSDALIPVPIFAVVVSLYQHGIAGCQVTWGDSLDACLVRGVEGALTDSRYADRRTNLSKEHLTVSVSILHDREWLGTLTPQKAAFKLRAGLDSLAVIQGKKRALFLPFVLSHQDWGKERFAKQLLLKAKITEPPYSWATFQTASWLKTSGKVYPQVFGFPQRKEVPDSPARYREDLELAATYILKQIGPDGLPDYCYYPVSGKGIRKGTFGRLLFALAALQEAGYFLDRADFREAARQGFASCLGFLKTENGVPKLVHPELQCGPMAENQMLAGLARSGESDWLASHAQELAGKTRRLCHPDGAISSYPLGKRMGADHDYLPGAVLLALAKFMTATGQTNFLDQHRLTKHLEWYQRRFRLLHPWGMVGWHPQSWSAWYALTGDPQQAQFVFEIADWALDWQHEKSGAFLTDLNLDGPSFHTTFVLEGIADAWALAKQLGDQQRVERYAQSWKEGMRFLDQLTIRAEDTFCMAQPDRALGGLRGSRTTSGIRIDFVAHHLLALMKGLCTL